MKDLEKDLERAGAIALNLADQLNEKIDECEALKKEVKWYAERFDGLMPDKTVDLSTDK